MWNNLDDIPPEPPERSQSSKLLFKDYWTATHYSDWNDDHQDDLLIQKDQHFLGDEGVDRMEFYVNHLNEIDDNEEENIKEEVEEVTTMYPLLDTILEETLEDLMMEDYGCGGANGSSSSTSSSGRWGWGWGWLNTSSDDDDSSSVIHCPNAVLPPVEVVVDPSKSSGSTLTGSHDLVGAVGNLSHLSCRNSSAEPEEEDYEEAPDSKKRRIGSSSCASPSPCPSVTESLIQFEALEKELIENPVFRTSATSAPFEDEVFLDCVEHPEEMEEEEDWICSESEEYCESTSSEDDEEEDPSLFCVTNRRKLHSFRSYGDGLHLLNDELDDGLQSPLEEGSTDNKRSSTEVLSEDSGYGGVELPPNTICSPDAITADAPLLLGEENKRRPSPLSLQEAEEFSMMNKWPEDLEEGGETRCRTSSSDRDDVIFPTASEFSSEGSALVGIGSTDLESSKFKLEERGEGEEETVGLHSASPVEQNSLDVQRDVTCPLESSAEMDSAFYPAPVVLKRYGPRQEVEVYITSSSSTPQGIELIKDDANQQHQTARGVHFSPVVSSVNWRESYLDQSEDEEEEEEEEDVTVEDGWQPEEEEEEEKVTIPSEQQQKPIELESPPLDGDSGASVVVVNGNGSDINNSNNDAGHTEQHNKKKPENLFQRFSLSRLSARMFARKKSSPPSSAELSEMPTTDINKKKKNKNKDAAVVHPVAPPPPEILQDQQQQQQPLKKSNNKENGGGHNNNKRRFFMIRKPFQRSSSTPPETLINKPSEPVKIEPEPIIPPPPKVELVESLPPISSDDPLPPIPAARMKKPPLPPRTIAARKNYISEMTPPTPPVPQVTSAGLEHALQHFKETARMDRERLANSVPDLLNNHQPTAVVAPPRPTSDYIDPSCNTTTPAPKPPRHPAPPTASLSISRERARQAAQSRASSVESAWNATATKAALLSSSRRLLQPSGGGGGCSIQGHAALTRPSVPGLLETNLDAPEFRLLSTSHSKETNLDELIESLQRFRDDPSSAASSATAVTTNSDKRFKSMLNLGSSSSAPVSVQPDINNVIGTMSNGGGNANNNENNPDQHSRAHKSMEFLLDEENKSTVQVPENQLQKCGAERGLSEHQLRIQRSLQKLNVPEWYKSNARPSLASSSSTGSSLRRRDVHQSSTRNGGGWSGLSSTAASSMTSLSSRSGTPTRVVIPTRVPRPDWRNVKSSKESLLSSPAGVESLPPRWGSGRYSYSACPSPSPSNSSCRSIGLSQQCGRQPYLGWRSQEKLNIQQQSYLATPSERLAASTVANSIAKKPSEDNMEEEIRQVTSAIVHYVDGKSRVKESHPLEALSRSPSPRRTRCVWVESSFVGEGIVVPPVNGHHHQEERRPPSRSPLPPVPPPRSSATQIRSTAQPAAAGSIAVNVTIESSSVTINAAPTLDDVLNSLLGLAPPPQQIRRPVSQNSITSSSNKSINNKDNNFDDIRSAGLASR